MHSGRIIQPFFSLFILLSALSSALPTSYNGELAVTANPYIIARFSQSSNEVLPIARREQSITQRAQIKTAYSADGWKVRYTTAALALPIEVASAKLQELYTGVLEQLPEGTAFDTIYTVAGRSFAFGGNGFWLNLRSTTALIKREFVVEVCKVLFEAAENGWAPFFDAEWISPARDMVVYVSVSHGVQAAVPGPLSI